MAGEGWWMGLESIDQPRRLSEVDCNPKTSIWFFWLERGGRWGWSPSTSPANHQKLNVIQKWAFYFLAGEGWRTGSESFDQPGRSSEIERNPKLSILFSWLERGGREGSSPSTSPANHQKLNVIQKWAFNFYGWRGLVDGFRVHWPAQPDHQKLNVIQKWAFYYFGWRGVADRVWVHQPARPIIRSWT